MGRLARPKTQGFFMILGFQKTAKARMLLFDFATKSEPLQTPHAELQIHPDLMISMG
jgi:hypothetical protein